MKKHFFWVLTLMLYSNGTNAADLTKNPNYESMMSCYNNHLITWKAATKGQNEGNYTFLNPPVECLDIIEKFINYCAITEPYKSCEAAYAAYWVKANTP